MKFGAGSGEYQRVDPVMTPMIDVCFQIIIFFIANMRIILPEGDFNVTMPAAVPKAGRAASLSGGGGSSAAGQGEQPAPAELPAIRIHLLADKSGNLAGIQIGERPIGTFKELRSRNPRSLRRGPRPCRRRRQPGSRDRLRLQPEIPVRDGRGDRHLRLPG